LLKGSLTDQIKFAAKEKDEAAKSKASPRRVRPTLRATSNSPPPTYS